MGKESACNAEDLSLIPGSEKSPGEGSGNPFQYPCLENPTDRGAWWITVYRIAKSWTALKQLRRLAHWNKVKMLEESSQQCLKGRHQIASNSIQIFILISSRKNSDPEENLSF